MDKLISIYRLVDGVEITVCTISKENTTLYQGIMEKDKVTLSVVTEDPVYIAEGDYILLNGIKYRINRDPEDKQSSSKEHSYDISFEAPIYTLIDKIYCNKITGSTTVTLTGKLRDFLELLIWNVNYDADSNPLGVDTGWEIGLCPDTDYMNITLETVKCRDALNTFSSKFGLEYYVVNKTINYVSHIENETGLVFTQGEGGGLYEVERKNVDDDDLVTRAYVKGGTDNVIPGEGDDQGRLMLPELYLENFSESNRVVEAEVEFSEIHPTFQGTVGTVSGDNNREFLCPEIDFDIADVAVGDEARVNFLTGDFMGKSFEFKWNNDLKKITLIYQEDDLAAIDPDTGSRPNIPSFSKYLRGGELFNFTGLKLSGTYKTSAITKLREKGIDWLAYYCRKRVKFELNVDYRYLRKNNTELHCGDLITINVPLHNISKLIRVTAIERNLYTGKLTCTVSNYLDEKWKDKIENQIAEIKTSTSSVNGGYGGATSVTIIEKNDEREPSDSNIFSSLRTLFEIDSNNDILKEFFLSRKDADQAAEIIDFLKGLTVNGDKASIDKDGNAIIQQLIAKGGIIAMTPKNISQLRSFISEAITEEGNTSEQLMSYSVVETDDEDGDSPESAMMAEGFTEVYTGTDGGASTLGGLDNVADSFDTLANGNYGFEMRDGMLCPTESVVIGSLPGTAYDGAKGAALEQAVKEIAGGGSGTMYSTYIRNNLDSLAFATQLNEECIIDFTFISLYRDDISEPYKQTGETGICTMMVKNAKYPDFTVVKQFEVSSAVSIKQEISGYLSSGSNNVKLTIKGNNTDSTTNPITYTIALTSLGVSAPNFSWWTAYSKDFTIPMIISGNINKTLYVTVTGENYSQSYTQNLGTATYVDTPYNYTIPHPGKNGVFNISFYLTNSDGTIQTKAVSVNVMCIKTSTEAVKLMCVNNVSSLLINWESNTVFNYSIYDGQATSTEATFLVVKSGSEVYRSENDSIVTNTKNTFTYPMEVETDDDANFQVIISTVNSDSSKLITPITIDVNNSLGYSATSGAALYINPRTRSNSQSNYLSVINEVNKSVISAVWTAMNWSNDGWYEDSEGNKALKIFARSSVAIDYQPFLTEAARIGKTIEIDFKVENASDASKDIISIAETNSSGARVGLKVSGGNVSFFSASKQDSTTQDLPIDNNTRVRLTVVVMPDAYGNSGFNLACLYINGKKNRVYNYESNDYFKNNGKILLGNDYANLYIYGIRVYNFALTENAVRKNYVNQLSTTSEKQTETAINKVFDAEGTNIDFDAVKNLFNCFVIDQKFPNLNNPGAVSGSLDVYFKDKPERNFHITNILWEGQGTSSKKYYEWNVRGKLNKGLDANGVAQNSIVTYADGTTESKKVRMFLGVPKANKLTAKKNWASSMQDHKAGSVSAFNDLFKKQGLTNEAITANKEVRVAVYQESFIGFSKQLNEEGQYIYVCMGEFTFGPDKGDSACFGYDTATFPNLLSVEGSDNAPLGALFRVPWNRNNPYWRYSADDESFQYNDTNCWDFDGGDLNSEGTEPKSTQLWVDAYNSVYVCSNRIKPFNGTLDELNSNVTTYRGTGYEYWISKSGDANRYNLYYYEAAEGKFISSDIGNGQINLKTQLTAYLPSDISGYTDNALNTLFINARVSLFVATSPTYWDIDDSVLAYVDTEFRAGTDERAKNTYPYSFGTPTSKWKWRKDDTDTIGPIDNQGQDKKPYWVEMHDVYSNGQPVWNGETSVFWNLLELGFKQKIISGARTMLSNMEALSGQSSGTPYDKVYAFYKKYFLGIKTYFPSAIVNADAKRFEDAKLAYIAGNYVNDTDPITQSHGDFYSAETAWFKKRIMYIMSKYNYGLFSTNGTDTIIVRAAGDLINYDITPAYDMYPAIANGTSIVQGARTKAGEVCRISIDLGGSADQQNAIQAASWLLSIGKWYDKNVSGTMIVRGRRLTTLELGSKTENVVISITGLTLSDCGSLQRVILSKIATL